jgi:hypothetical protein
MRPREATSWNPVRPPRSLGDVKKQAAGHVRVARRRGPPILDFFFLVYKEGGIWRGRSVHTGHVSASRTAAGAVRNLTLAIDAEIDMATSDGLTVREWYDAQQPDDQKYVRMFFEVIARKNPDRKRSRLHDGDAVMRAVVAKAA